ncbi:non-ribosomal peptide synthetase [Kordia jejudonensis]|uniref:non-ribosomal peptide synthetase n=1 Tax=Kordia jejudonensis TaxID=1348245 RepID=UPI000699EA3F|nr:non-ribosomal peptide synthetase [Kordia jejudonensis]
MQISQQQRIDALFREVAIKFPDKVAITTGNEQLTYKELNDYSDTICNHIIKNKLSTATYIGVCFKKSANAIIHILGILKAGYAYVPIDPLYPSERINYIIEDSQLNVIFSDTETALDAAIQNVNIEKVDYKATHNHIPVSTENRSEDAYVIYTSGTTGKPKGVVIQHQNVMRLFSETEKHFHFSEKDTWTLFHSLSFDFSVWEVFGALLHGGELVVVPFNISRNPRMFLNLVKEKGITILNQTPTAFSNLIREEKNENEKITSLRCVIFGGEKLDINLLKPWVNRYPLSTIALINMYGITETTVHVTYREITNEDFNTPELSPIGLPITDLDIHLLDENDAVVNEEGTIAEMYISGAGLAKEYLNKPALTEERFLTKTIAGKKCRLYKTGDEAYFANGEYFYVGRNDNQVQLNGFRIELDEIISVSLQHPKVLKSVVLVKKISGSQEGLYNYLLTSSKLSTAEKQELSKQVFTNLRANLPNYMIPFENIVCDEFPLTANGKLDLKALSAIDTNTASDAVAPPVQTSVASLWKEIVQTETIEEHADFFDIGGTSLSLIQLLKKTKETFGISVNTSKFIDGLTFASFVAEIKALTEKDETEVVVENLWKQVLQTDNIAKEEDFFDIGGTSLSLIQLLKKTKETFGISVNTSKFIDGLTFASFVAEIKALTEKDETEVVVENLWKQVLQTDNIAKEEDFFDIGGTSLSLIQLLKKTKETFGISVNTSKFIDGLTFASFVAEIKALTEKDETEVVVENLWKEVLQTDNIAKEEDFFDMGGTSLSLIQLLKKTKETFGISVNTSKFIDGLTFASFVAEIKALTAKDETEVTVENLWKEVLQTDNIAKEEDFFDMGGTSLSLIQLLKKTKETFGISVNTSKFIDGLTLTSFVAEIKNHTQKKDLKTNIVDLWKEVLQTETIDAHADFFDIGGTSLSLIQLIAKVKERYGIALSTSSFAEGISIESFHAELQSQLHAKEQSAKIAMLWKDILNIEKVPENVDFFDLGGTSLSLIQLIKKTQDEFGVKINTSDFAEGISFHLFVKKLQDYKKEQKVHHEINLMWEHVLGKNNIGNHDDFFDIGGTSLSLIQLIKQVKDVYGISLNTSQFTEGLTKSSFAKAIINQNLNIKQKIKS